MARVRLAHLPDSFRFNSLFQYLHKNGLLSNLFNKLTIPAQFTAQSFTRVFFCNNINCIEIKIFVVVSIKKRKYIPRKKGNDVKFDDLKVFLLPAIKATENVGSVVVAF